MNSTARVFAIIACVSLFVWPLRADDTSRPDPTAKAVTAANENGVDNPGAIPGATDAAEPSAPTPAPAPHSSKGEVDTPKVELFLGYSNILGTPKEETNRIVDLQGGDTNIAFNPNRYFGIVGDFAGYHANTLTFDGPGGTTRDVRADGKAFTYMAGPRFSYRQSHFTLFGQALFGDASAGKVMITGCTGSSVCTGLPSQNSFAMAVGAGLDLKLRRHIALRLIQAEYMLTRFKDPSSPAGTDGVRDNVRLSAGLVFSFGGKSAAPEPSRADCSIQPSEVFAGDFVTANARGSNFESGRTIRYSWSGTGVSVTGSNSSTQINTTGLRPGSYEVTANLSDGGKNGPASCGASFTVKAARPPVISCSADSSTVQAGGTATIRSDASSPDDRKLTYNYDTSAGNISGDTATAVLNTSGAQPGVITVTCHVSDDRSLPLTASATATVNVQAPPPPPPPPTPSPEMKRLESSLALHSIYFQTARPTDKNPGGGLLDSQAQILKALADDFTAYLKYSPDAHLILAGHADSRGTVEYNQALTQRRVDRSKTFLVEHGVPPDHIETKSLGKQEELTANEIKALIDQDPDLTPADRQQMLNNLTVMVPANNRRVDVTLSTTGQQSTRLYPFNAKDFLALTSTKSGK